MHPKKDLNTHNIQERFQLLISMDEQQQNLLQKKRNLSMANKILKTIPKKDKIAEDNKPIEEQTDILAEKHKQLIYTKSDIVKQISKLKPYLKQEKEELTTVEVQNYQNKKVAAEQKKNLSKVIIYLNKQLCQKLRQQATLQKQFQTARQRKEKQGWIYELFYRKSDSIKAQLSHTEFSNGYVVLTSVLELYQNLTFDNLLLKFNVSEVKRVKYTEEKQYQVIQIRFERGTLQLGFLSDSKLQLFDRMFFLLKNMARTSTKRLFQNQLIKSLYSEY